jgi:hypothetical protein
MRRERSSTAKYFDRWSTVQTGTTAKTSHTGIEQKSMTQHKAQGLQKGGMCEIAHGPFFHIRVKLSATFHFSLIVSFHEFHEPSATHPKSLRACGEFSRGRGLVCR